MASRIATRAFSTTARRLQTEHVLKQETKRNPELMILGAVMVAAFGGAGLYFGRSPTSATSEEKVPHAGNPWETGGTGKYQYYPGGDRSAQPKDAPSAVNTVVVPDVNLPKVRTQMHTCRGERRPEDAVAMGMGNSEGMPQSETREADMRLLQELHEKYNKWGKDGY